MLSILLRRIRLSLPLSRMATTDRQVLFICIGLSFVFWLILNLSQTYEITKTVRLEYLVAPERVLAGSPPREFEVGIVGSGWNLIVESMRGNSLAVDVPVDERPDRQLTRAEVEQLVRRELSSGDLQVDNLGYETQTLLTTPRAGKRVPVVAHIDLDYAPGFGAIGPFSTFPDSVTVSGSTDELEGIVAWPTEVAVLDDIDEDVVVQLGLARPPEGLSLNYDQIRVSVEVEAIIERSYTVPIRMVNAPLRDSSRVFPAAVTVTVTLPQSEYDAFDRTDFEAIAELSRIQRRGGGNTVPVELTRVPESIRNLSYRPQAVEYYIYTGSTAGSANGD